MSWRNRKDKEKDKDLRPDTPFDLFSGGFLNDEHFARIMKEIASMMNQTEDLNNNPNVRVKRFGPYFRGYRMTVGPDGKPKIEQFGNIDPQQTPERLQVEQQPTNEPLIDVFVDEDIVQLIAEIPGVEKEDIKVHATESKVKIEVNTERKTFKTVKEFGVKVKPEKSTSEYKNGILVLAFEREEPSDEEEFEVDIK